ncbi:hypothetical protein BDU57DRAFT_521629 [Ampelomyces quisqualis]|uniref:Uncharacterized protein n=1 Tax=Ampelomyces quisqualis TaxID=50730 RepID=A0A6A5QCA6_AMPQU|nr:hypothetical protein BDU57DRAFT_521629 [Ampelomyces quisqualis]
MGSASVRDLNLVAALISRNTDIGAREPHHKGKGKGRKNNRRDIEDEEVDEAHWADVDLETRAPHHKG